jgi:hypothetical protein
MEIALPVIASPQILSRGKRLLSSSRILKPRRAPKRLWAVNGGVPPADFTYFVANEVVSVHALNRLKRYRPYWMMNQSHGHTQIFKQGFATELPLGKAVGTRA